MPAHIPYICCVEYNFLTKHRSTAKSNNLILYKWLCLHGHINSLSIKSSHSHKITVRYATCHLATMNTCWLSRRQMWHGRVWDIIGHTIRSVHFLPQLQLLGNMFCQMNKTMHIPRQSSIHNVKYIVSNNKHYVPLPRKQVSSFNTLLNKQWVISKTRNMRVIVGLAIKMLGFDS